MLDSSAILALVFGEPGSGLVESVIAKSWVSAVNLSEVAAKLSDAGYTRDDLAETISSLTCVVADFDPQLAMLAGLLRRQTRQLGLSLGDRACLSLAMQQNLPALTADSAWSSLEIGVAIKLIR